MGAEVDLPAVLHLYQLFPYTVGRTLPQPGAAAVHRLPRGIHLLPDEIEVRLHPVFFQQRPGVGVYPLGAVINGDNERLVRQRLLPVDVGQQILRGDGGVPIVPEILEIRLKIRRIQGVLLKLHPIGDIFLRDEIVVHEHRDLAEALGVGARLHGLGHCPLCPVRRQGAYPVIAALRPCRLIVPEGAGGRRADEGIVPVPGLAPIDLIGFALPGRPHQDHVIGILPGGAVQRPALRRAGGAGEKAGHQNQAQQRRAHSFPHRNLSFQPPAALCVTQLVYKKWESMATPFPNSGMERAKKGGSSKG